MNELRRQAYLDAMGVDSYFPRAVLSGALPSPQCLIEIVQPEPEVVTSPEQDLSDKARPASVARDVLANMGLGDLAPSKKPESKPLKVQASDGELKPTTVSVDSKAPTFALTLLNGEKFTLVANTLADGDQQAYQQMMSNILFALADQPQTAPMLFNWPMINSAAVDQSMPVAKQALETFVQEQAGKRTVIVFGDCAKYLGLMQTKRGELQPCENSQLQYLVVGCAAEAFLNPSLKRSIWQDLLPVRQLQA